MLLEFHSKADAFLVERWLKCGDTVGKRERLKGIIDLHDRATAAATALTSATVWSNTRMVTATGKDIE